MDVTSKKDIARVRDEIASKEQCLCFLINNAGISTSTQETESDNAEDMSKSLFDNPDATFEDWTNVYQTNVASIYFMTTAFLPLLQKATDIHKGFSAGIINITSISGIVKTAQHHWQYNTSKGAAIHLNRLLASEIAENGLKIRVNAIAPGVFPSEMTAGDSNDQQKSHIDKEKYAGKVPANRPGKETDMANAILFVATNQYLNGQNIAVDGGYVVRAGTT
jgi:NAD(P)-dependent dehydrogenase (short-subunit alcohol dehydrogenase family)